jgi:hypothetical protein
MTANQKIFHNKKEKKSGIHRIYLPNRQAQHARGIGTSIFHRSQESRSVARAASVSNFTIYCGIGFEISGEALWDEHSSRLSADRPGNGGDDDDEGNACVEPVRLRKRRAKDWSYDLADPFIDDTDLIDGGATTTSRPVQFIASAGDIRHKSLP